MSNSFHRLKILAIDYPIKEATTLTFDVPAPLREVFHYYPGQHLIIKFMIDGKEVRRSYSINSCPFREEALQVTVKRVKGGLVSNFVGDHLKVGEELEVMSPQGRFYVEVQKTAYKTYFLFAAGSGITPIFSILKSVLVASPYSVVRLFYGNTNQDTILFKSALEEWQAQYPQRLQMVHTLSQPKVWTTWEQWKGRKGRIDAAAVEWWIRHYPPIAQSTEYYICGPGAMNVEVRNTLLDLGVPKDLIYIEQFGGAIEALNTDIKAIEQAQLSAVLNGQLHELTIPGGQTILQALKEVGANPPYSCESGVCATCVARITKGKAEMKACMALEEEEIAGGLILTCQAVPITKAIAIQY
ncbi:MAG: ferredoxin--NADP reductase [Bacteroidota bacterium]